MCNFGACSRSKTNFDDLTLLLKIYAANKAACHMSLYCIDKESHKLFTNIKYFTLNIPVINRGVVR
jgi:hypothetical protein